MFASLVPPAYAKLLEVLASEEIGYNLIDLVPPKISNPTNDQSYWRDIPTAVVANAFKDDYPIWPVLKLAATRRQYKRWADVRFLDPSAPLDENLITVLRSADVSLCKVTSDVYALVNSHPGVRSLSPQTLHVDLRVSDILTYHVPCDSSSNLYRLRLGSWTVSIVPNDSCYSNICS